MEDVENAMILVYDLCRLCLDEPGEINIFKPVDWSQDILNYTGLEVTTSDKFPQTICISCRDIISCVKVLKDIATANDERLRLIRGNNCSQVLTTDSCSHLVIISSCAACDNQNESSEVSGILSDSCESFKSRIVFESEDESAIKSNSPEKQSRKKNKSSDIISSAPKAIQVRKDLFYASESSATVTSSTNRSKESPTSSSNTNEEPDKRETSTKKKSKESPTSSSNTNEEPDKRDKTSTKKKSKVFPTSTNEKPDRRDKTKITKKRKECPTSSSSTNAEPDKLDKKIFRSSEKRKHSPTSTSGNEPEKILTFGEKKNKLQEYEHKCETCNKTYATSKKLYFHQLAHNKKFYCPLDACCKKFATKGDLQKHIRSHTGEKPYKCDLCDQSFTQNVTLKSHKESKHNEPKR